MEPSIFGFILRHSKREQIILLAITVASYPFNYIYLSVPKWIVNHLQAVITFLGGGELASYPPQDFATIELGPIDYLFALCLLFLALVLFNQAFKYVINVMSGQLGERMLRRLRYELYSRVLRFPLQQFKRVSQGELISMITLEVEPLGGFIGDAVKIPAFQGGLLVVPLIFIMAQNPWMGLAAVAMFPLQIYIIPKLQRRVNLLAKERVRTVRRLSERIGESVSGVQEIHANDASMLERTDIATRLGRIYRIRFDIFRLKFFIKFLNNTLDKVTPFFFYSLGGYLAIKGHLELGALVAVLNAHKDIAPPWKELLRWYQTKEDARIKYEQIIEQFEPGDMLEPAEIDDDPPADAEFDGELAVSNLTLSEDILGIALNNISFRVPMATHMAVVGQTNSGREALGMVLARLVKPTSGSVMYGGLRADEMPESVTGRQIAFVGQSAYLFSASVRENLLYGLKHRPLVPRREDADPEWVNDPHEAHASGNIDLDPLADWVDYDAAGVPGADALTGHAIAMLQKVDMASDIYNFGLRGVVDPSVRPDLAESILAARREVHNRLLDPKIAPLVELFNVAEYNTNATLAENLLFGMPKDGAFDLDNLAENAYVLEVLEANSLTQEFLEAGRQVAETMVELFADVAPGHPFFDQFSFISADDLPEFQSIVARVGRLGLEGLEDADRKRLLSLPFKMIPARHRLGVIDEGMQSRIVDARRYFAENLPERYADSIEFFDAARYISAASLQENILFGKIAYGQAQSTERIGALVAEVLDQLDLRPAVMEAGLDFHVGIGGSRLSPGQRQKLVIARALLRRPKLLILNGATTLLDNSSQLRLLENVLAMSEGRGVVWVLHQPSQAQHFEHILVLREGNLVEKGTYNELNRPGSRLRELIDSQ